MEINCLTYQQLKSYSENKMDAVEREHLYLHITSCELCACAVNGFSAMPFLMDEVNALHRKMDMKTKVGYAIRYSALAVFIILISLISMAGFYHFSCDKEIDQTKQAVHVKDNKESFPPEVSKSRMNVQKNIPETVVLIKKTIKSKEIKKTKVHFPVEQLELIKPEFIECNNVYSSGINNDPIIATHFNSDVLYIYDLKIADYNRLYFNTDSRRIDFSGYTPASKENKETADNPFENDGQQIIPADRILKKGLEYFNKDWYHKALVKFQLLLENNPTDVNALFYSAICYSQVGNYNLAIKNLAAVLQNKNNVFQPEAKWNIALIEMKTGNISLAKELLIEISNAKGFYAKRATEKLKGF